MGNAGAVPIHYLSDEDAAKVNLAVRLCIAKNLSREKMPLIIDGTSALASAAEIKAFIDCLVSMNEEQIIVMTDDSGMESVFRGRSVDVNVISL